MELSWLTVALLALLSSTEAYRILVVCPTPSYSHQRPHIATVKALAAHGHDVTFITTDPFKTDLPNVRQISISFLYEKSKTWGKIALGDPSVSELFDLFAKSLMDKTNKILSADEIQAFLNDRSQKFDAVILENMSYVTLHALAEKYNATLVGFTSLEIWPMAHRALGNPSHPLLHPGVQHVYSENPGLLERIRILYNYLDFTKWNLDLVAAQEPMLRRFFPEVKKTAQELVSRFDLAIECVSPAIGFVRPLLPNTKQIGGLHLEPPKALPKDLQDFLDRSEKGVVYLSFGSNVRSADLQGEQMALLKKVLGTLQYDVLWKFEDTQMEGKPKNVKLVKWAPQLDVLAHPKVRAFVTQGGIQSMEEAIAHKVPMVVIPFFGDQSYNAELVERLGIARKVLRKDLTLFSLRTAIMEVINSPTYRARVEALSRQMLDTPMNATETAVWHIEHAIRNRGADMFRPYKGTKVPFYQYYFLDVVALAAVLVFGALYGLVGVIRLLKGAPKSSQKGGKATASKRRKVKSS